MRTDPSLDHSTRETLCLRYSKVQKFAYYSIMLVIIFIILLFLVQIVIQQNQADDLQGAYFQPFPLAIANIVLAALLAASTYVFLSMLTRKFGADKFRKARRKCLVVLVVFSLSFVVRSAWDFLISFLPMDFPPMQMAAILFFFYFFSEWLPIFVVFFQHAISVYNLQKAKQQEQNMHLLQSGTSHLTSGNSPAFASGSTSNPLNSVIESNKSGGQTKGQHSNRITNNEAALQLMVGEQHCTLKETDSTQKHKSTGTETSSSSKHMFGPSKSKDRHHSVDYVPVFAENSSSMGEFKSGPAVSGKAHLMATPGAPQTGGSQSFAAFESHQNSAEKKVFQEIP